MMPPYPAPPSHLVPSYPTVHSYEPYQPYPAYKGYNAPSAYPAPQSPSYGGQSSPVFSDDDDELGFMEEYLQTHLAAGLGVYGE